MLPLIFLAVAVIAAVAIVVLLVRARRQPAPSIEQAMRDEPVLPQHVRRQPPDESAPQPVDDSEAYNAVRPAVQWDAGSTQRAQLSADDDPAWAEKKAAFGPADTSRARRPAPEAQREAPARVLPSRFSRITEEPRPPRAGTRSPPPADSPAPPAPSRRTAPPRAPAPAAAPSPPAPRPRAPAPPAPAPPPEPAPPASAPAPPPLTPAAKLASEAAAAREGGTSWLRLPTQLPPPSAERPAPPPAQPAQPEPPRSEAPPPPPAPAARPATSPEPELEPPPAAPPPPPPAAAPPPPAPPPVPPPPPAPAADEPITTKRRPGFDEKLDTFLKQLRSFSE